MQSTGEITLKREKMYVKKQNQKKTIQQQIDSIKKSIISYEPVKFIN